MTLCFSSDGWTQWPSEISLSSAMLRFYLGKLTSLTICSNKRRYVIHFFQKTYIVIQFFCCTNGGRILLIFQWGFILLDRQGKTWLNCRWVAVFLALVTCYTIFSTSSKLDMTQCKCEFLHLSENYALFFLSFTNSCTVFLFYSGYLIYPHNTTRPKT